MATFKLITWNVNGLRAVIRKGAFQGFLKQHSPDVLFLQEIKAKANQLEEEFQNPSNYEAFYNSAERPGYAGTALWLKKSFLEKKLRPLKLDEFKGYANENISLGVVEDNQGRISQLRLDFKKRSLYLLGIYFPNGGASDKAFEDKLVFYDAFLKYVSKLIHTGKNLCIWGGDINCAHTEIDLARPKENDGKVGFHPKERAWLDRVVESKWVDLYRHFHGDKKEVYSWWSMRAGAKERNVGWRIDYFFSCQKSLPSIKKVDYLANQLGSDHCPMLLEFSL